MRILKTSGDGSNKIQVHPKKTKYIFIGSPYNLKHNINDHLISIHNTPIARINNLSCLGANMDERLPWGSHIDQICSKIGTVIVLIRRIKLFVFLPTLEMLYNAVVPPYFDYCSPLWDNCRELS